MRWQDPSGYLISTDRELLELDFIHAFLTTSYWSPGIPRAVVERAIAGSLPLGLYAPDGAQAGFARVVTDYATYAYLADVPGARARGVVALGDRVLDRPEPLDLDPDHVARL
jgi:hypothetical protein